MILENLWRSAYLPFLFPHQEAFCSSLFLEEKPTRWLEMKTVKSNPHISFLLGTLAEWGMGCTAELLGQGWRKQTRRLSAPLLLDHEVMEVLILASALPALLGPSPCSRVVRDSVSKLSMGLSPGALSLCGFAVVGVFASAPCPSPLVLRRKGPRVAGEPLKGQVEVPRLLFYYLSLYLETR